MVVKSIFWNEIEFKVQLCLLISCVSWGKLFHLSLPRLLIPQMGIITGPTRGVVRITVKTVLVCGI